MPVADIDIFSLDKTTLANKIVLWDVNQCGQNSDMDCRISLFARGDY
jgi:hypothetical protein